MSRIAGSERIRALIVGCGAIAGGYDEADPASDQVLTHAKAYRRHPGFELAACVEPDSERRAAFMAAWGIPAGFASLAEVDVPYDVASVCVPTPFHAEILEALLPSPARLVFAEKPLTDDLARSAAIVAAYEAAGKPLMVNYFRRWAPGMVRLRDEIAAGQWGAFQKGSAWYTKGLLNNASHFLDLLSFLLGELTPRAALGKVEDGRDDDPTLDVVVATTNGAAIHLLGADMHAFSVFEADLLFSGGRVSLTDSGFQLTRRPVTDSPRFPGYRVLAPAGPEDSGLGRAMTDALDNIAGHLDRGIPLASDGHSALAAQALCARLLSLWETT
ncbi:Putative Dehydrogenase(NAD(P)-binding domain,5-174) [Magnetospirillum sp. XM-1]|uniref:Gfo/Idh/MocA family protein n=1 Tax=Magnetospirillum sp. XM-1 TaxID=1663591 RepID=UPI00073DDFA9|nr:Gfo/Idh/MocA family oxidoreductase [Magnetospirillum sp. XM-1]CUW38621.1 Putative Dehydrogenase(NAD(P)-binding domain,5-174) [Magnetospirillum sp. XM-1]